MAKKQLQQKTDDYDISKLENSDSSSHNQSNDQSLILDNEEISDNMEIPFENFRKSFSILGNQNKTYSLRSFIKIKSHVDLNNLKSAIAMQQSNSEQSYINIYKNENNENKNPQEFFSLRKVPPNTTLFIHIFSVDNKRCNISVTNVSGYVIAYFTNILLSRKFYKIYKILTKLKDKLKDQSLFLIYDEDQSISKDSSFVNKISDYATNFCYYASLNHKNIPQKFLNISLQQEKLIFSPISKNPTFIWIQNHIFWYFSQIFTKQQQNFDTLLKQMKRIQHEIQNPVFISEMNEMKDSSMEFIMKSILINLSKLKKNKSTAQLLSTLKRMTQKYEDSLKVKIEAQFGNPLHHYPEQIKTSKECVHCQNNRNKIIYSKVKQFSSSKPQDFDHLQNTTWTNNKQDSKQKNISFSDSQKIYEHKKSKTKYRCEGCSAQIKKDIPLCLNCFEDYHTKKQLAKKKNIKKAEYANQIKTKKKLSKAQNKNKINPLNSKENDSINQLADCLLKQESRETINNSFLEGFEKQVHISKASSSCIDLQQSSTRKNHSLTIQRSGAQRNYMDGQSEDEDSQYSEDICNKLRQLQQNQKYNKLLEKLEKQKKRFFEIFELMMKKQRTKRVATTTAEYVKFKALSLLDK